MHAAIFLKISSSWVIGYLGYIKGIILDPPLILMLNGTQVNMRSWNQIVSSLHDVNLQAGRDVFVWTLHSSGQFSVRSFYAALISNGVRVKFGRPKYLPRSEFFCGI